MKDARANGSVERDRLELGRAIRAARLEQGLRLADIAGVAAVSVSLLSQVERGLLDPSLETLRKVAAALGTTPFRLLSPEVEALAGAGEEAYVILAGQALLELGEERVRLGPGDHIAFDARLPHRVVAEGDEAVVCLDVICPPSS